MKLCSNKKVIMTSRFHNGLGIHF